jgi:hypothetical protein
MNGRMTKAEFDRLDEDDRWMLAAGFDVQVAPVVTSQEQAIADRDAIIAAQHQVIVAATEAVEGARAAIDRFVNPTT